MAINQTVNQTTYLTEPQQGVFVQQIGRCRCSHPLSQSLDLYLVLRPLIYWYTTVHQFLILNPKPTNQTIKRNIIYNQNQAVTFSPSKLSNIQTLKYSNTQTLKRIEISKYRNIEIPRSDLGTTYYHSL